MLTEITYFDTAVVKDKKNSIIDIVSACKPHCNTTKSKLPWEFRDVNKDVSMLGGLLLMEIFVSNWQD